MSIYWLEIKRFFKENKINIIKGTFLLGIVLGGIITVLNQPTLQEEHETEIEDSQEVFENNSRSAFFRFYIEKPDGTAFGNSATMDQLFNLDSVYDEALIETDIDINKIKEMAEEKEVIDFSPVKVKVNDDSNIFIAIFETGDNKENIALANFYYDYLFNRGFNILEDHELYSLVEPELVENNEEKEDSAKIAQSRKSKPNLIKSVIVNLIIGLILSAVLIIGLLLLKELFGKELNYFFGYDAEDFDDFILYDKQLDNKKIIQYFVNIPHSARKLVLTEKELSNKEKKILFNDSNVNFEVSDSIENTLPSHTYNEIILIVKTHETTRNWYNKQSKLINLHNVKTKVIQFNDDFDTNN